MHSCFFDVLHDAANHNFFSIADRVNVDLYGIIQKTVKQDG